MNYDHYIAVDWAKSNMAVARLTKHGETAAIVDVPSSIADLRVYLQSLKGRKILTFEESTPAHWLYVELRDSVDDILVCDPYRNHLLREGSKTDKVDANKMVFMLRAGLLKPVFHSTNNLVYMRKLVRGYENTIKLGVRLQNQRAAILRSQGEDIEGEVNGEFNQFVTEGIDKSLEVYKQERRRYESEFRRLSRSNQDIKNLTSIPGIGIIGAVKIVAIVVDVRRFENKGRWLSYCGLVRHRLISGGRCYGSRNTRHSRSLKAVFKTAAIAVLNTRTSIYGGANGEPSGVLQRYYQHLVSKKGYAPYVARHAVARRIATIAMGILKEKKKFDDRWRTYDLDN